jgi:hypothetical protein
VIQVGFAHRELAVNHDVDLVHWLAFLADDLTHFVELFLFEGVVHVVYVFGGPGLDEAELFEEFVPLQQMLLVVSLDEVPIQVLVHKRTHCERASDHGRSSGRVLEDSFLTEAIMRVQSRLIYFLWYFFDLLASLRYLIV